MVFSSRCETTFAGGWNHHQVSQRVKPIDPPSRGLQCSDQPGFKFHVSLPVIHSYCNNLAVPHLPPTCLLPLSPASIWCLIRPFLDIRCPRSGGDKSRAPTLCLVCGSLLCSQSYCCQTEVDGEDVGACTAHTFTCGAGLGLFLRYRVIHPTPHSITSPPQD